MTTDALPFSWSSGIGPSGSHWLSLNLRGVQVGLVVLRPEEPGVMTLMDLTIFDPQEGKAGRAWRALIRRAGWGRSLRGQGLGTRLLHTALEVARQEGCQQVRVYLIPSDLRARPWLPAWYERHGFVEDLDHWATREWRTLIKTL